MSEITQTITVGDGSGRLGNCLQAAVASLLDLPLDEVPHFAEIDDWNGAFDDFAEQHGFRLAYTVTQTPEFGLAFGLSARGVAHSVVYRDGTEVWDPHPSRDGLRSISAFVHFNRIES